MSRTNVTRIAAVYSLIGCVLIFVATARYGVGLSSDSVTYLAGARNILEGRGYANFDGAPVLAFPPLFSITIAMLSAGLFDLASAARFLNALCFGSVVFLSAHWLFRHLDSRFLAVAGATTVLVSAALIGVSIYAWSEPLFIVLTLLMLLQFEKDDPTDSGVAWVLAGIFAALTILTRYAGISVVLTGAIVLALQRVDRGISWIRRLALFLSMSMLPIGLWFYRNYALSSTITGYRVESARTVIQTGYDLINVLSLWFLPEWVPYLYRWYLIIFFGILFGSIILLVYKAQRSLVEIREIIPFLVFALLYTLVIVYTTSTTALSPIDDRYMSPLFVPLMLSLFYLLDRGLHNYSGKSGTTFPRVMLATSILIWLIHPIFMTYGIVKMSIEEGAGGFNVAYWAESDLIAYLKSSELSGTIYTNEPSAVYALTGQVYLPSPEKVGYESDVPTDDLLRFQADLQNRGELYIVWFHTDWWKGYLYEIDELQGTCDIEKIVTRKDGDIYRMRLSDCE